MEYDDLDLDLELERRTDTRPGDKHHSYAVDGGEIGGREHQNANFGCPRCDRELNPGPWNSWICWWCDNIVYVEGGER